jgi:enterochelin esterase-like enzyme
MLKNKFATLFPVLLVMLSGALFADGKLHGPEIIKSEQLGYDLQYWVYQPEGFKRGAPELYVTDGAAYLFNGKAVDVLDREIATGRIEPVSVVFVDSRDPYDLEVSRRNREFMCNTDYARFFVGELMPRISSRWTNGDVSTRRGLMGLSFGAINSACFGAMIPGVFQVLVMHSPGGPEHIAVIEQLYQERPKNDSAFFISHGGADDNEQETRKLVQTLEEKGYDVRHVATGGSHDWQQWKGLIDDGLQAFAGTGEGDRADSGLDAAEQPE